MRRLGLPSPLQEFLDNPLLTRDVTAMQGQCMAPVAQLTYTRFARFVGSPGLRVPLGPTVSLSATGQFRTTRVAKRPQHLAGGRQYETPGHECRY